MDALWPRVAVDIDPVAELASESRNRPDGRPWVTMLMIASIDGAAAVDGVSGPLGAPADKAIFKGFRCLTDVVLVGGGTARAENYGPIPHRSAAVIDERRRRGQSDRPQLAVVSGSLAFAPDARLFSDETARPLVYTTTAADTAARAALETVAEIAVAGEDRVDPDQVLADFHARGHGHVLLEGGPRLNADFLAADGVDEVHLSLAPVLVGGSSPRIVEGPAEATPEGFRLDRIWSGDELLFLRYLRSNR